MTLIPNANFDHHCIQTHAYFRTAHLLYLKMWATKETNQKNNSNYICKALKQQESSGSEKHKTWQAPWQMLLKLADFKFHSPFLPFSIRCDVDGVNDCCYKLWHVYHPLPHPRVQLLLSSKIIFGGFLWLLEIRTILGDYVMRNVPISHGQFPFYSSACA